MSVFLDILRCVLCCVEDEDENEVLYRDTLLQTRMNSSNQLFNIEEAYAKFVSIFHSNRTENVSVVPSYNPPAFYSRLPKSSSIPSPSRPKPQTTPSPGAEPFPVHHIPSRKSLNPPPSTPKPPTYVSKPSPSFPTSVSSSSSSSKQTPVSPAVLVPKATISFPPPVSSSSKPTLVSPIVPPSFKPVLAPVSANSTDQQNTSIYILDEKDKSPIYAIPKDIKDLIKKDKVPDVLKKPLTLSTYKDYFTALLYAEDFYIEKWSEFKLVNVTLKLQKAEVFKWSHSRDTHVKEEKTFDALRIGHFFYRGTLFL
ncbi:extensin-like [Euphorbia lathyris]|uniref:extensin-like n=1 Tax=Euphorbia lathyris TaxID=212925 RepID=UPI003314057A